MKGKSESEVAQSCLTLRNPTRLLRLWDFPGKSTGVGCHCLLQIKSLGLVELRPLTSPEGQAPLGPVALVIRADLSTI